METIAKNAILLPISLFVYFFKVILIKTEVTASNCDCVVPAIRVYILEECWQIFEQ